MPGIDDAIRGRREIEFVYDGLFRIVQPAVHGIHKGTHNEVVRGYQVGGRSKSSTAPQWKLFSVAKIRQLVVTERRFIAAPPDYDATASDLSTVFAQLP